MPDALQPVLVYDRIDANMRSLVVTRGLLELLDHRELEAVIAHELSHIGNLDIQLTTALAALVTVAISPFSLCAALPPCTASSRLTRRSTNASSSSRAWEAGLDVRLSRRPCRRTG